MNQEIENHGEISKEIHRGISKKLSGEITEAIFQGVFVGILGEISEKKSGRIYKEHGFLLNP